LRAGADRSLGIVEERVHRGAGAADVGADGAVSVEVGGEG
jgi:hypothetical protein